MKKFAIKGLVALAAVVALSMFFSGTIKTIFWKAFSSRNSSKGRQKR